jgi:hypothetical protein
MTLSARVQPVFDALMAAHPEGLTLDELSEELIYKPLDFAEIEELIGALEMEGIDLEGPGTPASPEDLLAVLGAARAFTTENARRPTVVELAERTGLSPIVVRRALNHAKAATPR